MASPASFSPQLGTNLGTAPRPHLRLHAKFIIFNSLAWAAAGNIKKVRFNEPKSDAGGRLVRRF